MVDFQSALPDLLRRAQQHGFYLLVTALMVYTLWVRVGRIAVERMRERASMRAAREPGRVRALDEKRRAARLRQARQLEAEQKALRSDPKYAASQVKKREEEMKKKKKRGGAGNRNSAREYNPLMGPTASRGYRPSSRMRRSGGG